MMIQPLFPGVFLASNSMTKVQVVSIISKIKTALKAAGRGKRTSQVRKIILTLGNMLNKNIVFISMKISIYRVNDALNQANNQANYS
ncbi:hypothetical protein [Acinetobacter sp. A2]|uniref:hypothetical protein n=1 Tax=Acinetobacter sp. A2 TaxID=362457 RepID=UPI003AF39DB1